MGMVQALDTPGTAAPCPVPAISLSVVMPAATRTSGLRLMTVSNISVGAGSVAVLARPALPKTDSTSGKLLMILFWVCISSAALVMDMPGSDAGMYSSVPSLSVGMNSEPSWRRGRTTRQPIDVAGRCQFLPAHHGGDDGR